MSELLFAVALVTMMQAGTPVATATGFFYTRNDTLYFVTNRHVVIDEAQGLTPDTLKVRLHTDSADLSKNVDREIPLYVNGKPRWHVDPSYAKNAIDVAVVEIDPKTALPGVFIKALNRSNFLPNDYLVTPGEDIMVIGFPRGFSDNLHNLPLIRNALISSAYGVDFNGCPCFLVDANLHHGMSGSPVLTRPKNTWPTKSGDVILGTGSPSFFLGVFSATFSIKVGTQDEALGLGQVWYGNAIEDIIASIP